MSEERPRRRVRDEQKNKGSGWQLLAVQSISCVVLILVVLLFRMIGGSAFKQLRKNFNDSIMSNSILATLAALMDSPDTDTSEKETTKTTKETQTNTTSGAEAQTDTGAETQAPDEKTAETDPDPNTQTTAPQVTSATEISATGGKDISISKNKIEYAPNGASFAKLKINRIADRPLESQKITSRFGYRKNSTSGKVSFHQGLDIAAKTGDPITAMFFGVVKEVGQCSGYGNYIRIYHGNGIEVLYAHCSEILADKDAVIRAGEVVARVGSTGDSTGPHLHIETTLNGVAYDPLDVVFANIDA
ncbi:MAG: M23 family metallopeptidase [Oscillospiraceae bacterium]|nr:M23 family metallopeptidase [Oscillospiraceae bacterium]MDD3832398.1 M23 family metallopeptidase [Oscillospiraceae bacterium]MDD4545982.1 M23 family metallopeptidase [Oscillospiraceae bacterium]